MRVSVIFISLLLSFCCSAQKVKKVVVDDYDCFCKHEYTVLKKDKSVKHGPYKSTWVNGNPRQEGYYKNGHKDSIWTYWDQFKALVASRGHYSLDKKIGIWEYFDDKGRILNRYDHSKGFLSHTTFEDTVKTYEIRTADTLMEVKLERSPIYLPGEKTKFRTIQENIVYPIEAIELNVYGTVWIGFYVDIHGKTKEHEVVQSIGGGCDEEALRVVKLIPDEWAPAIYKGKLTEVKVLIPITFQLN